MNTNNNKNSIGILILTIAVLILGAFGFLNSKQTQSILDKVNETPKENNVGAVTGPDIYSDYMSVNGSVLYVRRMNLRSATTTVCSLITPPATTTLQSATVELRSGTTTAMAIAIGTATNNGATTTRLAYQQLAASQTYNLVSTSTALTDLLIAPSTFINVVMAGAPGGDFANFAPRGTCNIRLLGF